MYLYMKGVRDTDMRGYARAALFNLVSKMKRGMKRWRLFFTKGWCSKIPFDLMGTCVVSVANSPSYLVTKNLQGHEDKPNNAENGTTRIRGRELRGRGMSGSLSGRKCPWLRGSDGALRMSTLDRGIRNTWVERGEMAHGGYE